MSKDELVNGPQIAARILKVLGSKDREKLVQSIQDVRPDLALKIQFEIYDFSHLATVSDDRVQRLLGEVPERDLVVALKRANSQVKEKIIVNLPREKQKTLVEEFKSLPSLDEEEIHAAQVRIMRRLDEMYAETAVVASPKSRIRTA
jgi:flagellar motor switch protein FliG